MTKINCYDTDCIYNKARECQADEVEWDGLVGCDSYEDCTLSPEYRSKYYKRVRRGIKKNGVPVGQYKLAAFGKRCEESGIVVYIIDNDRYGRDWLTCTEETTGMLMSYSLLFTEDGIRRVREEIKKYTPVASLREITTGDAGGVVFVEEGEQK